MNHDPDIQAWIDRAKTRDILEVAQEQGAVLKRSGGEWVGPCPACNGTDRFAVNTAQQVFNCRGAVGGDVIKLVEHVCGASFMEAVEIVSGEPPPKRESTLRPADPEIQRERRDERRDVELGRQQAEQQKQERAADRAARIFNSSTAIAGTLAEAYLRRRAIILPSSMTADLRFAAGLEYRGYADPDATEETPLGVFPCMVAAIRSLITDEIIGLHRTYLEPSEPMKLKPPGDPRQNKAKKSFGTVKGGAIRLGPMRPIMAIGEGIETSASWWQIGKGPDEVCVVSAVSLGNLSGEALESVRHPSGRGRIPNGAPNPDKPGILLPDEVQEVVLLGDGDSDLIATHARLLVAAARFRAQGRTVTIHYAPPKADWNDVLIDQRRAA
ncbi:MAG: hypothetical protein DI537_23845 [Stutzerimonas stutzeri]|nr:MAG: hypothetical protein DI537_23845 [Stutzerimonas stutzeri]